MNKSIIVFLGLLVILLPIGTSLNNPNANAIADFDNGDRKQVSVSSLKCNNINVNVNGLELSVLPPFLGGGEDLAAEAQDANTDASSFATGNGGDGSKINDFRFICINNNNNTVIEEEEPIPPIPSTPCELCFAELSTQAQENINNFLEANGPIPIPQTVPSVSIPSDVDTITELCAFLSAQPITVNAEDLGLTELVSFFINLTGDPIGGQLLVTCLIEEARVISLIT
jgi:hypothetical protein